MSADNPSKQVNSKYAGLSKPGQTNNPGGRPKLSDEHKEMKNGILTKAIEIMYKKINDEKYVEKLKPGELFDLLTLAYDRCGLPKVQKNELSGDEGGPIALLFPKL